MTLDILENSDSIKLANDDIFNSFFNHSTYMGKYKVNYEWYNGLELQKFSEESDIYCLNDQKIWFSHIKENQRFLYAFGIDTPKGDHLNEPIFVIDFSVKGVNRNTLTTLAIDDNSDIFVLLRVNYNKLRDSFHGFWTLAERIQAIETNNKKYFINLGQLNQQNFLENFTKIINDMGNIKNLIPDSTIELSTNTSNMTKSCILCSKTFSKLNLEYDSNLNKLINENPDKCLDCLKKIYTIEAINKIKEIVSLKLFNEKTLLNKADPGIYSLYLDFLKKENIIKKFGNNNDFYLLNETVDLEEYNNIYSKFQTETNNDNKNISDKVSNVITDKPVTHKICKICELDVDSANFFKDESSKDGLSSECKKCSRKSYAVNALEKIEDYVEHDTPFKKEDILKQVPNRMQFLDYIWTLQEFNLLTEDEKLEAYILKPQKELNDFKEKYGDKKQEVSEKTEIKLASPNNEPIKKVVKTCEICGKKLPISDLQIIIN